MGFTEVLTTCIALYACSTRARVSVLFIKRL